MERKSYGSQEFWGYKLVDYWNLSEHPLYIKLLSKTKQPYFKISEAEFEGSTKITYIGGFVKFFSKHEWLLSSEKKLSIVINQTQGMINIPYTPL